MTLTAGTIGIDYSGYRPNPAQVYKDGARFIIRYSAGAGNSNSNTAWKLCGTGEIAAAVKAGLDVIANSEWYESRVTEGASAGTADGKADLAFWKSRGLNKGASIYCSWDEAAATAKFSAVDAYLKAYRAALGGYYTVSAYAGTQYLKHAISAGVIAYGWRPNAGSWSNDGIPYQPSGHGTALLATAQKATPAAIWQTGNYWYNKNADENLILRVPCGSHLQGTSSGSSSTAVKPPTPATPTVNLKGRKWPSYMPTNHYYGLITGPAQSHGGYYAQEQADVKAIQQQLIKFGFVPGQTNPTSGWADGKFEQPTADAVTRFQRKHMPGTTYYGQVWTDDWAKLFGLG